MPARKRKGSKGRSRGGLDAALRDYATASKDLQEFETKHEVLVDELEDLQIYKTQAKLRVETEALETSDNIEKGKHTLMEAYGFLVRHSVGARRKVDVIKLMQKYPEIWQWKGLLTVVVGKFDAAVESEQIDRGDVESLVSTIPRDSIEIVEQG